MTPAPPATSLSARVTRGVLLGVLALALTGLALPRPSHAQASAARPTMVAAFEFERPLAVAPVQRRAPRRAARASRSVQRRALWVRPVWAPVVSPFGARWGGWHPGIDFGASYGTPIEVVGDGVVLGAGYLPGEDGYGLIVLVQHSPGVVTAYAHCSRVFVQAGQRVQAGETIALVGATGAATGPHLHFEVRLDGVKVNPVPWLRAHGIDV